MLAAGAMLRTPSAYAAAPAKAPEAWSHMAGLSQAERQAVIEKEALREGKVTIYGALGIDRAKFLVQQFNRKYPSIQADFVRLTQSDLLSRLQAENKSDQVSCDLVISVVTYLDIIKECLAPYEASSWADLDERFKFGSAGEGWTSVIYELLPTTIAWRTDKDITRENAPKNLQEMQDAVWKGRSGCTTQLEEFIDAMVIKYGKDEGMAQVGRLAGLDNKLVTSNAALAESLGSGQIDVTWNFVAHRAYFLQRKGAPIDWIFMEPQFAQGSGISATRLAPSPYAAALFMDYLLEAKSLEQLDKLEAGRIFGNRKGKYELALDDFADLTVYRPIPTDEFRRLNGIVQQDFVRRQKS